MNAAAWALAGLFGGAILCGVVALLYFVATRVALLASELREFNQSLSPILKDPDLPRAFKAFQLLAAQGEQLGRGMEKLDTTIQKFFSFTFKATPTAPEDSESFVTGYNEAAATRREAETLLRKEGIETDESRVSIADSERHTSGDVF